MSQPTHRLTRQEAQRLGGFVLVGPKRKGDGGAADAGEIEWIVEAYLDVTAPSPVRALGAPHVDAGRRSRACRLEAVLVLAERGGRGSSVRRPSARGHRSRRGNGGRFGDAGEDGRE